MSVSFGVTTKNGRKWHVGSYVCSDADVIIPVDQIAGMTAQEIGENVLALVRHARLAHACQVADMVGFNVAHSRMSVGLAKDILRSVGDHAELLEEFASDSDVLVGWQIYQEAKRLVEMSERGSITKKQIRREAAQNYDALFVAVGKRDGFKCRVCETSDNLTLDHLHPVSLGGTNDLENLGLLCRSHNSSKGANIY